MRTKVQRLTSTGVIDIVCVDGVCVCVCELSESSGGHQSLLCNLVSAIALLEHKSMSISEFLSFLFTRAAQQDTSCVRFKPIYLY